MKLCEKCGVEKETTEFYTKQTKTMGRRPYSPCKECLNAANRKYLKDNRTRHLERNRERYKAAKEWLEEYKSNTPCKDCRQCFPAECMDFDHLDPNQKVAKVSDLTRNAGSKKAALEEIKKCDLVCANCHRIRTRKQQQLQKQKKEELSYGQ